jgi:hypothetical protein
MSEKIPPIGLTPRKVWDIRRASQIYAKIKEFENAGEDVPNEWIEEYEEIRSRYGYRKGESE